MRWQAPDFHYEEKSSHWHLASIIVAIIIVVISLFQGNVLFAFFIIIAEGLILTTTGKTPNILTYSIEEKALVVKDGAQYEYENFYAFAINETDHYHHHNELTLIPKKSFRIQLKFLIPIRKREQIRDALNEYLDEAEHEASFSEQILKRLGL